ncbi:glycosyltransferase family 2 protein [Actibacterium sp. D379-3]
MTLAPRVSVVVVSHQRPAALALCLTALTQLDYPDYEIVVAADGPGLGAVDALGLTGRVKTVPVGQPGISAARNAGLAQAAGAVVAFIDDDAVAEPTWLTHLAAPFADSAVAAAGGFVRGRNGISFQWRARQVDPTGAHSPLPVDETVTSLHSGNPDRAIKTEGTNMAFRRSVLADLGGFDPAYRFFLDETDLNMRLARCGAVTAIVPLAQVHHGYAASSRRTARRVPRTLFEIGASTAVFLRKHAPENSHAAALAVLWADQRKRLLRHMVEGGLEPRDVARLMRGLEVGIAEGLARPITPLAPLPPPLTGFLPFAGRPGARHQMLAGRVWQARRLRAQARAMATRAAPVTLFLFSPTALFHRMRFDPGGYWEQRGGLFGRSDRKAPLFRYMRFAARVCLEIERLSTVRPIYAATRQDAPANIRTPGKS